MFIERRLKFDSRSDIGKIRLEFHQQPRNADAKTLEGFNQEIILGDHLFNSAALMRMNQSSQQKHPKSKPAVRDLRE